MSADSAIAGVLSAAVLFLAVCAQATAAEPPCPLGEKRGLGPPFAETIAAGPAVVGCVQAPHLGRRELIAYRDGRRLATSSLCVDIVFADGSSGTCGPPPTNVHGLDDFFGIGPTPDGAAEFHGFASVHVKTATVRYWSHGKLRWQRVIITRVTLKSVLATLGLSRSFAYYNVALAANARYLAFSARNKAGKIVFRRFMDCVPGGPGCALRPAT